MEQMEIPKGLAKENARPTWHSDLHSGGSVLLEFKDGSSDKFWGLIEDEGSFIAFWGRNGRRPQQSQRIDSHEAYERLSEKLDKGYEPSPSKGKLLDAFLKAPEWFQNIKSASPSFLALVERARLHMDLAAGEAQRASEAKKRREFRL